MVRQEGAVVVGVVPGQAAFVHRLLPQRDGELDQLDGFLAVQHHGLAVGLDLLAAKDHRKGYHQPGASPKVWPAVWPIGRPSGLELLAGVADSSQVSGNLS